MRALAEWLIVALVWLALVGLVLFLLFGLGYVAEWIRYG